VPISVRCDNPDCGKSLRVKDELAGRRVKCPSCGEIVSVPDEPPDARERPARSRTTPAAADHGRGAKAKRSSGRAAREEPMPDEAEDSNSGGGNPLRKICIVVFVGLILFPPFHTPAVVKLNQGPVNAFLDRNTSFVLAPPAKGDLLYPWTINGGRLLIELGVVAAFAAVVVRSRRQWVAGAAVAFLLGGGAMVYVYEEDKSEKTRAMLDNRGTPPGDVPGKEKLRLPEGQSPPAWKVGQKPPKHPRLGPPTEPTSLPAEVAAAWRKAGFNVGWMDLVGDGEFNGKDGKPGQVPAFLSQLNGGVPAAGLPAPDAAFGLYYSHDGVKDAALKNLAEFKNLQVVTIASNFTVSEAGLMELAALEQLQSLRLSGARITDAVLKEYSRLSNLRVFHLPDAAVTDAGLKHLAGMTKLQSLDLGHVRGVTDKGLKELSGLTDLQWLRLTNTGVTDAGLKELTPLTKLKYLELNNVALTDLGLQELKRMTHLRYLAMISTKVTAAGVEDLHRALPDCKIYGYTSD
jgi:hypothetical protein